MVYYYYNDEKNAEKFNYRLEIITFAGKIKEYV